MGSYNRSENYIPPNKRGLPRHSRSLGSSLLPRSANKILPNLFVQRTAIENRNFWTGGDLGKGRDLALENGCAHFFVPLITKFQRGLPRYQNYKDPPGSPCLVAGGFD